MAEDGEARRGRKPGRRKPRKTGAKVRRAKSASGGKSPRKGTAPPRSGGPVPRKSPPKTKRKPVRDRGTPEVRGDVAQRRLFELLYDTLRGYARGMMSSQRKGHTLQPTALVHAAYAKLFGKRRTWKDRNHFIAAILKAMQRLLIDHARRARRRQAPPRAPGGGTRPEDVGAERDASRPDMEDWARVAAEIEVLAKEDARAAEIAQCRLLGGFELKDVAQMLRIPQRTVERKWAWAYARLREALG